MACSGRAMRGRPTTRRRKERSMAMEESPIKAGPEAACHHFREAASSRSLDCPRRGASRQGLLAPRNDRCPIIEPPALQDRAIHLGGGAHDALAARTQLALGTAFFQRSAPLA